HQGTMKTKEFTQIGRQLLDGLPGFVVNREMLFVSPIEHTLRAIFFNRAADPRAFHVQALLLPLCVPAEDVYFNVGFRVGGDSHTWSAGDPRLIADLSTAIKREALPFLGSADTPKHAAETAAALGKSGDGIVLRAIAYWLALAGERQRAVRVLNDFVA